MAKHYLLDTRTTYERVRDWICGLFQSKHKTQELEVTRFLSSHELANRYRLRKRKLSKIRPTEPTRENSEETVRSVRKTRVYLSHPAKVVVKNSSTQCHSGLDGTAHSNRYCLECLSQLPSTEMDWRPDYISTRLSDQANRLP